jgi:hypothetical protein
MDMFGNTKTTQEEFVLEFSKPKKVLVMPSTQQGQNKKDGLEIHGRFLKDDKQVLCLELEIFNKSFSQITDFDI